MNQNIMANKMSGGGQSVSVDVDTVSHRENNPSIGEVSLSLGSGTHLEHLGREQDRESSSTVALAGSILAHKWVLDESPIFAQPSSPVDQMVIET